MNKNNFSRKTRSKFEFVCLALFDVTKDNKKNVFKTIIIFG